MPWSGSRRVLPDSAQNFHQEKVASQRLERHRAGKKKT